MLKQLKKYVVFIIGGGLGAFINWTITVLLTELFGMWYMASYAIGQVVNIIFNFVYHRHITFKKTDNMKKRLLSFIVVSILLTILNMALVYLATESLKIFYLIPIIVVTILISIFNYILNKEVVFK